MDRIQFRPARSADADRILEIKQQSIEEIDTDYYTPVQIEAWRPTGAERSDFKRAIESNEFDILLAVRGEAVVGYGVLNTHQNRIEALFVHPEFSGNGIGTSLVRQFESRARIEGLDKLTIVSALNAKRFYESLGYWDCGRKTRTIRDFELQFALMRKQFDTS